MADARSTGAALYQQALAGGDQACGVTGGLAVGRSADIVALNPDHLAFAERQGDAVLDTWIFAAPKDAVASVWRRGERVVVAGAHVGRPAIEARYRRALAKVLA